MPNSKRIFKGSWSLPVKGVMFMEIMQMILIIAFTALLVELIKNIKK